MTDNTQPEALRLAAELEFVSGGWGVADQCCAELRRQHARIAELESELEAVGAGGVQALSAAPATPPAPAPQQAAPKAAPGELSADSLRHQNKLLAETLGACILASGIVRKDIDGFTGPELLHFGEDLRSMLEVAPQPAPAPLSESDDRKAFEQDFMRALPGENLKRKFGHYEDPRTRHRWDGWKARASHGQAPSQAGEYPALVCDYCGALTPDPWHSSGMLHGKMSKHIHSCDACAAREAAFQPSPKAAPVTQQAGYAEVIECGNSYAKVKLKGEAFGSTKVGDIFYTAPQQEATKAAPGVGNGGFDHKTAADLLNNKIVSDEAVRKFVAESRWAHDEKAALSAMLLSVRGVLASREAEIALLKKALLEAEATPQQEVQEPCPTCAALAPTVMLDQVSFDRKPDCYGIRQITDDEGVEEWEDIRTNPDVAREEANDMMATGRGEIYEVVPLWTTPQPAPDCHHRPPCDECAAIAAQGDK